MISYGFKQRIASVVVYIFLAVMAFLSIFPFLWMVIGATNTTSDIVKGKMTFGEAVVANATTFFTQVNAPLIFWNSAKITIIATVLTLLISSLAGYGFEIFSSRFREKLYTLMLLSLMIPFAALMIPLFMLMGKFGLINTHIAVVLPTVASAFIIFYFRQSTKAFPHELRDAARVDGLKEWQIFFLIYMPVMRSTYAAAFIIVFMTAWNSYLWPLIVLQSNETKTITLVISSLGSAYYPDYGVVMIGTVLATIPTLFVFFAMQRQFVEGMLGSVK
ncbi:carbohydrate ABC transporter permease [Pleomorphomonas oryzae]|uniref:carbohydrate ABC transporter permease n=1 Tax=Pleomorphomonas oryzae TaxID=261934 RepID=UPI000428BBBB|nr:carbohydrate ABC transporter permease [Pleomorphomonas oryzae]